MAKVKTTAEIISAAFARAQGRTAAVHYLHTSVGGYATYAVGSSASVETAYSVTVSPAGHYRCTCPSEMRPACWHRAAVYQVRATRQAWVLPADGPSAEEERAAADTSRPLGEIAVTLAA